MHRRGCALSRILQSLACGIIVRKKGLPWCPRWSSRDYPYQPASQGLMADFHLFRFLWDRSRPPFCSISRPRSLARAILSFLRILINHNFRNESIPEAPNSSSLHRYSAILRNPRESDSRSESHRNQPISPSRASDR